MIKKRTASLISIILNPVFAMYVALAVALQATETDQKEQWSQWLAILNLILPIIVAAALMKKGFALDDTLANSRVKRERILFIAPFFLIGLFEWYLAVKLKTGQPFLATIVATTIMTGIVALISYQWKISNHLTNISALVVMATLLYGTMTLWLALLIPITAWSRRTLERHTNRQIIGGTLLAPAIILPVFYLYRLL